MLISDIFYHSEGYWDFSQQFQTWTSNA